MSTAVAIAAVVLAASGAASGVLLWRTPARVSAAALLAGAASLLAAVAVGFDDGGTNAVALATACGALAWPTALLAYPSFTLRHGLDFALRIAAVAAGLMAIAQPVSLPVRTTAIIVVALALVIDIVWRYDRASELDRVPLLWMSLATGSAALIYGLAAFLAPATSEVAGISLAALVPPVLVLGVRRPIAVDVRALVISAVVFAVAVVSYVALFVGVAATFDAFGADELPVGALAFIGAIAAAGFHPLRVHLRTVVDELLFGGRPDPLAAVTHVATQVATRVGDDPALALSDIREALVLPYAGVWVDGVEVVSSGAPVPHTRRLPLALGDGRSGEIVLGMRTGDLNLTEGDERVLRIVTPLLAQTMRAHALAADLRASRGHAIVAIEEERRRLRRDLHDGLGPTLSGIAFTADAARNSLGDANAADELLRTVRADAVAAIGEIRRLVYGMRPPSLDELGHVPALRQWAVQVRAADGAPFVVDIDAPMALDALPAAVEVAAYRIAVEAITNAARHSASHRARATIAIEDAHLSIAVCDEGRSRRWSVGVGISSMRERAAEVGGTLTTTPSVNGGSVVARLPLG
jgi:signal transduction histidine kinase